jgi:hypothetical protein
MKVFKVPGISLQLPVVAFPTYQYFLRLKIVVFFGTVLLAFFRSM